MLNLLLKKTKRLLLLNTLLLIFFFSFANPTDEEITGGVTVSGKVLDQKGTPVAFATVAIKNSSYGSVTNENGDFHIKLHHGEHILCVSMVGYENQEKNIVVKSGSPVNVHFVLKEDNIMLEQVVVTASSIERVKNSAFNAVAVDTHSLQNSSKNISDALSKSPGLKLRESGGVGSDLSVMLDGFTGKHVKVFIDGVPQEGVGGSLSLNNIPVGFAERIEVY